jgi:hypothetical protein
MKAYGRAEVWLHTFFILALGGVVSFMLQLLYLCKKTKKKSPVLMECEAGWAPDMVLHFEGREDLLLPGFETYVWMK